MRLSILFPALLLAACGGGGGDRDDYNTTGETTRADNRAAAAVENAATAQGPAAAAKGLPVETPAPDGPRLLPVAMQGRWGMTLNDCDVTRDDAKGRMEIDGGKLRFYESRGQVRAVEEPQQGRAVADIAFEGEGQEWRTRTTFALEAGGTRLVRIETDPAGRFVYQRCQG